MVPVTLAVPVHDMRGVFRTGILRPMVRANRLNENFTTSENGATTSL
jgi:hypothetical protein